MKSARKQTFALLMVWISGMIIAHLSLVYRFAPGIIVGGLVAIWLPLALILRMTLVRISNWLNTHD
jgi:hypothetical protein